MPLVKSPKPDQQLVAEIRDVVQRQPEQRLPFMQLAYAVGIQPYDVCLWLEQRHVDADWMRKEVRLIDIVKYLPDAV